MAEERVALEGIPEYAQLIMFNRVRHSDKIFELDGKPVMLDYVSLTSQEVSEVYDECRKYLGAGLGYQIALEREFLVKAVRAINGRPFDSPTQSRAFFAQIQDPVVRLLFGVVREDVLVEQNRKTLAALVDELKNVSSPGEPESTPSSETTGR